MAIIPAGPRVEVGGSKVQGQPWLCREFEASLGCMRYYLRNKTKTKTQNCSRPGGTDRINGIGIKTGCVALESTEARTLAVGCWVWGTRTSTEETRQEKEGYGQTQTDPVPAQALVEVLHPDAKLGAVSDVQLKLSLSRRPRLSTPRIWRVTEWRAEANVVSGPQPVQLALQRPSNAEQQRRYMWESVHGLRMAQFQ